MSNYNFRWKFTGKKGRRSLSLFVKKINNFKELLWVINNFNERLRKIWSKNAILILCRILSKITNFYEQAKVNTIFDENSQKFTIERGWSRFLDFFVESWEFLQAFTNTCYIVRKFTKIYNKKRQN